MHWPFESVTDIEELLEVEVGSCAMPLCSCVELVAVKMAVMIAEALEVEDLELTQRARRRLLIVQHPKECAESVARRARLVSTEDWSEAYSQCMADLAKR